MCIYIFVVFRCEMFWRGCFLSIFFWHLWESKEKWVIYVRVAIGMDDGRYDISNEAELVLMSKTCCLPDFLNHQLHLHCVMKWLAAENPHFYRSWAELEMVY